LHDVLKELRDQRELPYGHGNHASLRGDDYLAGKYVLTLDCS
jgi:hypothetical protein